MLALLYQQILSAGYFYEQQAVTHNITFPCTSGFTIYIYTYAALPNLLGSGKVLWYHSHLCWLVFGGAIPYALVFIQKTFVTILLYILTLTFPCRRLHDGEARWDRIECNMTSDEPFSDDIMRAVNSTLQIVPSINDSPIGWYSLIYYITIAL